MTVALIFVVIILAIILGFFCYIYVKNLSVEKKEKENAAKVQERNEKKESINGGNHTDNIVNGLDFLRDNEKRKR